MDRRKGRGLKHPPHVIVGLTGGLASGKTTIARMFADLGAVVINADAEGRAVVAPGEPALAEVIQAFGTEYLQADGTLNRAALGACVFSEPQALARLNRITHPRIADAVEKKIRNIVELSTTPQVVMIEAAILVEAG